MASVLESSLGDSFRSIALRKPEPRFPPPSDPVPITGSLPSHATKPLPSLSMVFGRNKQDQISKSWSDLWDEEEESEGEDAALQERREQNSRSWSHESNTPELSEPLRGLGDAQGSPILNIRAHNIGVSDIESDELDEKPVLVKPGVTPLATPPQSPDSSPKKGSLDKWAALGDKRRNYKSPSVPFGQKSFPTNMAWRKDWGLGSSGFDYGSWAKKDVTPVHGRRRRPFLEKGWRREAVESPKSNAKPFNSYDGSVDEDLDLVGGWHDLHL